MGGVTPQVVDEVLLSPRVGQETRATLRSRRANQPATPGFRPPSEPLLRIASSDVSVGVSRNSSTNQRRASPTFDLTAFYPVDVRPPHSRAN